MLMRHGYTKYLSYDIFYRNKDMWLTWLNKNCWKAIQEHVDRVIEDIRYGYS